MPGSEALLDTNAVIALTRDEPALIAVLSGFRAVSISLFTLGEMHYGVAKSARPSENLHRLEGILASFRLIVADTVTARVYGDVFHQLRLRGRPIPTNDVWIAALALQHGLPLLTRDGHFREVQGLDVRTW